MSNKDRSLSCAICSGPTGEEASTKKVVCTSCIQKMLNCKRDSDSHETSGTSAKDTDVDVTAISNFLERVELSDDDDDDDDGNDGVSLADIISVKMAMNLSDDELFRDPPPKEECQICMLPMGHSLSGFGDSTVYMPCCGKTICQGCVMSAWKEINEGNLKKWCPFCRVPVERMKNEIILDMITPFIGNTQNFSTKDVKRLSDGLKKDHKEKLGRFMSRIEAGDAKALFGMGTAFKKGDLGLPQDVKMAMKLYSRAGEFGLCTAHFNIAVAYWKGDDGVEVDNKKALCRFMLAAIGGHEHARCTLGLIDKSMGNMGTIGGYHTAMKHFMIAAKSGLEGALKEVALGYKAGHVSKDEYATTLRAYQVSVDEMKSEQRTKARLIKEEKAAREKSNAKNNS